MVAGDAAAAPGRLAAVGPVLRRGAVHVWSRRGGIGRLPSADHDQEGHQRNDPRVSAPDRPRVRRRQAGLVHVHDVDRPGRWRPGGTAAGTKPDAAQHPGRRHDVDAYRPAINERRDRLLRRFELVVDRFGFVGPQPRWRHQLDDPARDRCH